MAFFEKGPVRIHYQEAGSGFPVFMIPGGGQNSVKQRPALESAMLAPKAEMTFYPWKDTREKIPLAVRHVRTLLKANRPA